MKYPKLDKESSVITLNPPAIAYRKDGFKDGMYNSDFGADEIGAAGGDVEKAIRTMVDDISYEDWRRSYEEGDREDFAAYQQSFKEGLRERVRAKAERDEEDAYHGNPLHAQDYLIARSVGGGLSDTYAVQLSSGEAVAWERMMDEAGWDDGTQIEWAHVRATDAGAARLKRANNWTPLRARPRASMPPMQNPGNLEVWSVMSTQGTEGLFPSWEKAEAYAEELRDKLGARNVRVVKRSGSRESLTENSMNPGGGGDEPPNPDYSWYLVDRRTNKIVSGWEYKQDAVDDIENQPSGRELYVRARRSMAQLGVDPDDWASWEGAPSRNPAGLTAKGERMYKHVKAGYSGPRAKEIASRTVRARASEGVPGLARNPVGDNARYFRWVHEATARNLWVQAYADYVERQLEEDAEGADDLPRPGGGEDWYDYAPETPESAEEAATLLLGLFEKKNGMVIAELLRRAAGAEGVEIDEEYAKEFGSDLGMMGTGTGVSWFDDHVKFSPLENPFYFEANTFDGETLDFSGRA